MSKYTRKSRHSKLFTTREVGGHLFIHYITEDLTDEELREHLDTATHAEDFEYAQAVVAEIDRRDPRIFIKKQ